MDLREFEEIFDYAKLAGLDVAIELTVPTRNETEIIIVKHDNLKYKLDYYKNNYNENLELIRCTDVKVLNAKAIKFEM